eukprot:373762-Rhodomonas_salina.2
MKTQIDDGAYHNHVEEECAHNQNVQGKGSGVRGRGDVTSKLQKNSSSVRTYEKNRATEGLGVWSSSKRGLAIVVAHL